MSADASRNIRGAEMSAGREYPRRRNVCKPGISAMQRCLQARNIRGAEMSAAWRISAARQTRARRGNRWNKKIKDG